MSIKRLLVIAAAAIAGASLAPPLPPSVEETTIMTRYLYAPKFLALPEGRIAYDDIGKGPLVILVPGLGDIRAEYRSIAPQLAASGKRVITMDLRGHGQSSTGWRDYSSSAIGRDVLAMIEQLDAGPAVLVGTSMGAGAVAWAAAERPDLVSGLALIGPFVREVPPPSRTSAFFQKLMIKAALAGPWGPAAWGKAYQSFYGQLPDDFDAYRTALVANLKEPGRMAALKGMIAASKADVETRLAEVRTPVLVIMGSRDPDFPDPKAEADTVAGLLKGRVAMIDGAGHYPHVENPGKVSGLIVDFIGDREN